MSSIIPNFEYDIFISYRHKDNKGDHWVTDFVTVLKTELESTFKEDITIYFDANPHDGLLETHSVDKSLEGKLKCLIFIPIISQTYCDPKSFAWKHEFCAFNKLATEDQFGRDIKLSGGNVTSRILPIKIHDLDSEDKTLLENELGGVLRAIEFIYKEPGVNRPLKSTDNKNDNLNKSDYRNQVNKVANAVKEIITAFKNPPSRLAQPTSIQHSASSILKKSNRNKILTASLLFALLATTGYFLSQKLFPLAKEESSSIKSIAVLPFDDMSQNQDQAYLGDGFAEAIINSLTSIKNLKVIGRTSSFQFKGEKIDIQKIGNQLKVNAVLQGSVHKLNNRVRVTVQLINPEDNSHLWSDKYDIELDDIFKIQDDIASNILEHLRLQFLGAEPRRDRITNHAEAYDIYLRGLYEWRTYSGQGFDNSIELFKQAIAIDSSFALAYAGLAWGYIAQASIFSSKLTGIEASNLAKPFIDKALELNPDLSEAHTILGYYHLYRQWNFEEAEKEYKMALELAPNDPDNYSVYCDFMNFTRRHKEGLALSERQMEIEPYYPNARKPFSLFYVNRTKEAIDLQESRLKVLRSIWNYDIYGFLNLNTGKYGEAILSFQKAMEILKSRPPRMLGWMGAAYVKAGQKEMALGILNELALVRKKSNAGSPNFFMAVIYTALDDKKSALDALEKAYNEHDWEMPWLISEPQFYPLHQDARFKELVKKVGFPDSL